MCGSDSVGGDTSAYEYCPFRFGLLRNTPHSGKIVSTRPLALWLLFSYSQHAKGRLLFQVLLPFSPVSGVVPLAAGSHLMNLFECQYPCQCWHNLAYSSSDHLYCLLKRLKPSLSLYSHR